MVNRARKQFSFEVADIENAENDKEKEHDNCHIENVWDGIEQCLQANF